jgi:hypothetical protein
MVAEFIGGPIYKVPLEPFEWCVYCRCHQNVLETIEEYGGSMMKGYSVWSNGFWLTTEQHRIWVRPDGRRIDVTPEPLMSKLITFVPSERDDREMFCLLVDHPLVARAMNGFVSLARQDYERRINFWRDGVPIPDGWDDEYEQVMDIVEGLLAEYQAEHGKPKPDLEMVRETLANAPEPEDVIPADEEPPTCSICGEPIPAVEWGYDSRNAEPVAPGECCPDCDAAVVIPARLKGGAND